MKHLLYILIILFSVMPIEIQAVDSDRTMINIACEVPLTFKTSLKISSPKSSTVWNVQDPAEIIWTSKNIAADKTIKFYLIKEDIVIQELGIYKNNRFAGDIVLNKSLQTADNYRVMGIELFPDDKKNIAKFATPSFTIIGLPRIKKEIDTPVATTPKVRNTFDGRTISYVKELEVHTTEISINLWDHGRKDDDIVSIYLNGEAIVYKYFLDYRKKQFNLKLDPSKPNDLFLYAHNLGKFPPNTVAIEIIDGKNTENIILNSDLKSCEAVTIKVIK